MKFEWDFKELLDFSERLTEKDEFQQASKKFTKALAKELHEMLFNQTPVKTGRLAAGWGGAENYAYQVVDLGNLYEVTLVNEVEYALSVNDGHYSYNQFNVGTKKPYKVVNRTPKMHTVPGAKQGSTYVYGHFFVEKSILLLENSTELDTLLEKELYNWFRWCVSG